jgi:hypothetical protein
MGAVQNLLGYGWLWLIVARQAPPLHLWMVSDILCLCWFFFWLHASSACVALVLFLVAV